MQIKSPAFLDFEAVKECFQVVGSWVLEICKDICSPSIATAASEASAGDLLEHMCNMQSSKARNDIGSIAALACVVQGCGGLLAECRKELSGF